MNTLKLEKQLRLVTLFSALALLVVRQFFKESENPIWTILSLILGVIILGSFFYRIYLEKKSGRYVAKRYYILYFFIVVAILTLVYGLIKQ